MSGPNSLNIPPSEERRQQFYGCASDYMEPSSAELKAAQLTQQFDDKLLEVQALFADAVQVFVDLGKSLDGEVPEDWEREIEAKAIKEQDNG